MRQSATFFAHKVPGIDYVITSHGNWSAGLGYDPEQQDETVLRTRKDLAYYSTDPVGAAKSWGVAEPAFTDEVRGRVDELLRAYVYAEPRLLAALRALNERAIQVRRDYPGEVSLYLNTFIEKVVMEAVRRGDEVAIVPPTGLVQPNVVAVNQTNSTADGLPFNPILDSTPVEESTIACAPLRALVNDLRAVQREYQILAQGTWLDCRRLLTQARWDFGYAEAVAENSRQLVLSAEKASQVADGGSGLAANIFGLISAVTGVLALIPVLTPLMAPIALLAGVAAVSARAASISIRGDWDKPTAWLELGADVIGALPGIGALAKGARTAKSAATALEVGRMFTIHPARIAIPLRMGARAFVAESSGASVIFSSAAGKLATRAGLTAKQTDLLAKSIQGTVELSTQIPLVTELAGAYVSNQAKDASTGFVLTANVGKTAGDWAVVGSAAKRGWTASVEKFASVIKAFA
ncbi:hypothetical protein [Streptomyces lavendulae]|uniref:hypothetical protein n=1 Tax=Streptomyces lavendulae TaxID=1914 RepID=UPI0037F5BF4F